MCIRNGIKIDKFMVYQRKISVLVVITGQKFIYYQM